MVLQEQSKCPDGWHNKEVGSFSFSQVKFLIWYAQVFLFFKYFPYVLYSILQNSHSDRRNLVHLAEEYCDWEVSANDKIRDYWVLGRVSCNKINSCLCAWNSFSPRKNVDSWIYFVSDCSRSWINIMRNPQKVYWFMLLEDPKRIGIILTLSV